MEFGAHEYTLCSEQAKSDYFSSRIFLIIILLTQKNSWNTLNVGCLIIEYWILILNMNSCFLIRGRKLHTSKGLLPKAFVLKKFLKFSLLKISITSMSSHGKITATWTARSLYTMRTLDKMYWTVFVRLWITGSAGLCPLTKGKQMRLPLQLL